MTVAFTVLACLFLFVLANLAIFLLIRKSLRSYHRFTLCHQCKSKLKSRKNLDAWWRDVERRYAPQKAGK